MLISIKVKSRSIFIIVSMITWHNHITTITITFFCFYFLCCFMKLQAFEWICIRFSMILSCDALINSHYLQDSFKSCIYTLLWSSNIFKKKISKEVQNHVFSVPIQSYFRCDEDLTISEIPNFFSWSLDNIIPYIYTDNINFFKFLVFRTYRNIWHHCHSNEIYYLFQVIWRPKVPLYFR